MYFAVYKAVFLMGMFVSDEKSKGSGLWRHPHFRSPGGSPGAAPVHPSFLVASPQFPISCVFTAKAHVMQFVLLLFFTKLPATHGPLPQFAIFISSFLRAVHVAVFIHFNPFGSFCHVSPRSQSRLNKLNPIALKTKCLLLFLTSSRWRLLNGLYSPQH